MRRIRRLLPAALLVLMATLLASRLFAPDSQWKGAAHEAIAAAFYGENWNLAARAVDYLAAETAPSPIQHYWSLSVEEQFYAVWPILVLIAVLIARRLGRSVSSTLVAGLRVVVASPLAYSIYATAAEPSSAYFVTPTRVWELGVGGLLAALVSLSPRLIVSPSQVTTTPSNGCLRCSNSPQHTIGRSSRSSRPSALRCRSGSNWKPRSSDAIVSTGAKKSSMRRHRAGSTWW